MGGPLTDDEIRHSTEVQARTLGAILMELRKLNEQIGALAKGQQEAAAAVVQGIGLVVERLEEGLFDEEDDAEEGAEEGAEVFDAQPGNEIVRQLGRV